MTWKGYNFPAPEGRRLVMLLHAYESSPKQLATVAAAIREALPDAGIISPPLPLSTLSTVDPEEVIHWLCCGVNKIWGEREQEGRAYEEIILVGHSFGGILARRLYCSARGMNAIAARDESARQPWSDRVTRIVLLAGMNRGWSVTSAAGPLTALMMRLGSGVGHLMTMIGRTPIIFALRRGAPFLTLMRLQWLALQKIGRLPLTIQLLGTQDDMVSPSDNIDLATGSDFFYLEVPHSGHLNVIRMNDDSKEGKDRRDLFKAALQMSNEELRALAIRPADMDDLVEPTTEDFDTTMQARSWRDVERVVFVIHGIRDKGFWTKKIGRAVKVLAHKEEISMRSVTSTYGYFAMLPFLAPWTRRAKVEWLLDQYVQARAFYPNAQSPSYIGHSNGTYLLAGALAACPAVRFDRVVFAGSVVRDNFTWPKFLDSQQVTEVLNYVATADWVVAIFPKALQTLRIQDLGGAGHDGFTKDPAVGTKVENLEYVEGRHAAALDERHWPDIARFIVNGDRPIRDAGPEKRSKLVQTAGVVAPALWIGFATLAAAPAFLLLSTLGFWTPAWLMKSTVFPFKEFKVVVQELTRVAPWVRALGLAGYMAVLRLVLTRF